MKKYLTMFIAMILTNQMFAQNITGKVADEQQAPIPYASCVLMNASDSTFVAGAVSNSDGVFNLTQVSQVQELAKLE